MKPNILFVEAAVILLIGGWSVVECLLSIGSGTRVRVFETTAMRCESWVNDTS